jgi:hypothetical protein
MSHHVKRRESRHARGMFTVWCSCGWQHDCPTKLPDAVESHHVAATSPAEIVRAMQAAPNDYRGRP